MATKLIFSFDSEDYITPEAADAELWWAEAMTRHGFTACVCVVAELARALHERGRTDLLTAWQAHEIAYHTDFHSRPPTPAQYLDGYGWDDGITEFLRREAKGVHDLAALTGQHPSAFCKPGNSWGPQACVAMARMGIPVFCDSPFLWDDDPTRPMWYAGQLLTSYHCHFDGYFDAPEGRLDRMKADFEERLARHDGGYLVMYTHPCRLVTADFWDAVNFSDGRNPPRAQWRPAPLRPPEEIEGMKRDFDAFLAWVATLPGVEPATWHSLSADYREHAARILPRATVLELLRRQHEALDAVVLEGESFSPAEIFGLGVSLFAGDGAPERLPDMVPLRRLLGPKEASLERPDTGLEATRGALQAALAQAYEFVRERGRVPASALLGRANVGPGSLLKALARLAREPEAPYRPTDRLTLDTGVELPRFAFTPPMTGLNFKGTWTVFPPAFEGKNVARMARYQAWTAKPALPSARGAH